MRVPLILFLAGCSAQTFWPTTPGTIAFESDEFTGGESLELDGMQVFISGAGHTSIGISIPKREGDGVVPALISFARIGGRWRYLTCHQWDVIIDESRSAFQTTHDGHVGSGGVSELVSAPTSIATLEAMSNAGTVRMRVCQDVFELDPSQREAIGRFVTAWRTGSVPAAPAPRSEERRRTSSMPAF